MALVAHLAGDRRMHGLQQDTGVARSMRIVTGSATGLSHGVIQMLLREKRPVRLVTFDAGGDQAAFQKVLVLGGCMRTVADETILFHRTMRKLVPCHGIAKAFMATETEVVARLFQIELEVRRMRIVAFHAIPFHHVSMSAFRIPGQDLIMTTEADLVRIRSQKFSVRGSVGIMAVGAAS
jgi:hypothetical protein